jgi:hypothetical protein
MSSPLYVQEARRRVLAFGELESFGEGDVVSQSREAMNCLDCEAWLCIGTDVFRFLNSIDERIRLAVYEGKANSVIDIDQLDSTLLALVSCWLETANHAVRWIQKCEQYGFVVEGKLEFVACLKEARAYVGEQRDDTLPQGLIEHRNLAVAEIKDGTTAEFFPCEE